MIYLCIKLSIIFIIGNLNSTNYLHLVSQALSNRCYFLVLNLTEDLDQSYHEKAQERSIFEGIDQFVDRQDNFSLISSIERYILNGINAYNSKHIYLHLSRHLLSILNIEIFHHFLSVLSCIFSILDLLYLYLLCNQCTLFNNSLQGALSCLYLYIRYNLFIQFISFEILFVFQAFQISYLDHFCSFNTTISTFANIFFEIST